MSTSTTLDPVKRKPSGNRRSADTTKQRILESLAEGHSVEATMRAIGKTRPTYDYHRREDPDFAAKADALLARQRGEFRSVHSAGAVPDFPEFCEKYLHMRLFTHQLQWFDVLEGRDPRDLHPSMIYEKSSPNLLVVNTPPEHAKSTTITMNYAAWSIFKDPNIRILLVSKRAAMAKQFLGRIKQILTHPAYAELNAAFGPPEGWDHDSQQWAADAIYVSNTVRNPQEKDPTAQALGIGGSIYGARADLIILDDCVDNSNAHEYEKQLHWLQTEVMSRLADDGKLLVVGTRLAPKDLYGELLKSIGTEEDDYDEEVGPTGWTYFAQPAILEAGDRARDWVTLWPRSNIPSSKSAVPDADGLYPKWDGVRLARKRGPMEPDKWARVYMQAQIAEDQTFQAADIEACTEGRTPGRIPANTPMGRREGMEGLYILGGIDPAAAGFTAMTMYGVDRKTLTRHVIDCRNVRRMDPEDLKGMAKELTELYGVQEWRVEKNAFQEFLVKDHEMVQWMASRGVGWMPHHTNTNKWDAELGVAAMQHLFKSRLITLPRAATEPIRALVEQLCAWQPNLPKSQKTDLVMSLWFCEIRAQELLSTGNDYSKPFIDNPFLPRGERMKQRVVDAADFTQVGAWWQ